MIGSVQKKVFQFSLSTAYDVSTASYDNVSVSVATQAPLPRAMKFKPDGTRLYIVNYVSSNSDDAIYQYNLSSPFDLSTMTYSNNSLSVGSQNTHPRGLTFKPDGTKLFLCGQTAPNKLFEYDLTTPWDLSTASYSNKNFTFTQEPVDNSWHNDVAFDSTGRRMFSIGNANNRVYQWLLGTPWDISTATYNTFYQLVQDDWNGIAFSPDETKMYAVGSVSDDIFQYSVGKEAAWFETKLTASNAASSANYGKSVAIDEQGIIVMVGSHKINSGKGEVYVYQRTGDSWSTATEQKKLTSLTSDLVSNDQFGVSVALSKGGGTAVVGADEINVGSSTQAGGIYLFTGTRI